MTTAVAVAPKRPAIFWFGMAILFLVLFWLLSNVLLPFLLGIGIAYFLNPACQWLIQRKVSRTVATLVVLTAFILIGVSVLLLVVPLLVKQLNQLVQDLPGYIEAVRTYVEPRLQRFINRLPDEQVEQAKEAIGNYAGTIGTAAVTVLGGVWRGGMAVIDMVTLAFITPIVAFYMLRDWPGFMTRLNDWLPRPYAKTIRTLMHEIDTKLAGFIRGQATVCFMLAGYYVIALLIVGLNFGVVIGLFAGLLSFIPFVGSTFGLVAATGIALAQYDNYTMVAVVIGIFMFAQFLEGNFITPKFVGESVGLHPVWVMFALMAGGSLFGFSGLLLAVPVTAIIGVLARFGLGEYLKSSFYKGEPKVAAKKA